MNIYLFNKARDSALRKADEQSKLFECIDIDHTMPMFTGLDNKLNIFIWCLECGYRKYIGLDTYDRLLKSEGVKSDSGLLS